MSNESWQYASQIAALVGLILLAIGGYGAFHFSKLIEREKDARAAYAGGLKAAKQAGKPEELLLSGPGHKWPVLEFGDSGAKLVSAGPEGSPLFRFGEDVSLTVVNEAGSMKVSLSIQDSSRRVVAELSKNEWKVNPSNSWDRNYTADSLEVMDPTGDVVLQVRAMPDRIQLQAKLWAGGRQIGFGKILGPDGWGGALELTGPDHPRVTLKITPRFKYPSDRHLGELVSDKPGT